MDQFTWLQSANLGLGHLGSQQSKAKCNHLILRFAVFWASLLSSWLPSLSLILVACPAFAPSVLSGPMVWVSSCFLFMARLILWAAGICGYPPLYLLLNFSFDFSYLHVNIYLLYQLLLWHFDASQNCPSFCTKSQLWKQRFSWPNPTISWVCYSENSLWLFLEEEQARNQAPLVWFNWGNPKYSINDTCCPIV